jgi:hypothetical protein
MTIISYFCVHSDLHNIQLYIHIHMDSCQFYKKLTIISYPFVHNDLHCIHLYIHIYMDSHQFYSFRHVGKDYVPSPLK